MEYFWTSFYDNDLCHDKLNDTLAFSLPAKVKTLLILAKTFEKQKLNFSRSALFHMKLELVSNIL